MIFMAPVDSGKIRIANGIFVSTEMGKVLAEKCNSGELQFNKQMHLVHLPYDGLLRLNYGADDQFKIKEDQWHLFNLPPLYNGERLAGKKLIIFPMHGLGDQLYLAIAIRNLKKIYSGLQLTIVSSSLESAEQWYPFIYHDSFYTFKGPFISTEELAGYDYYLDAEHFAHMKEYPGTYPPEFYMTHMFHHPVDALGSPRPDLGDLSNTKITSRELIDTTVERIVSTGKPVVFVSTVTSGRVRDIPDKALLDFIVLASTSYSLIVSTYKKDALCKMIEGMKNPSVTTTENIITDVTDLIYLIQRMDYVLTSDSGITHLSEGLQIPCGSIFNVVTPAERIKPYLFSEDLMIDFEIQGVCKTPCYVHALEENAECPGMREMNKRVGQKIFWDYPPCMENMQGSYLMLLLDAVREKFHK